jgi:3-dehydroquinate dehydratase / shikimate dehydrogenase
MVGSITLVATLTGTISKETVSEIPNAVKLLRISGDPSGGISTPLLRNHFPGKLLYSPPCHRPNDQSAVPLNVRHHRLVQAACEYDFAELDADCDLTPEVLAAIPPQRRFICWRGPSGDLRYLRSVFGRISAIPARTYSMIVQGSGIGDGAKPLQLLKEAGRRDLTAVCDGKAGFWSRILAPHFGAPLIFGRLDHNPIDDSGEPSVHQLIEDYAFPALHPIRELYGIVGNRVFQSPSPRLHNAGYRAIHHPALFLPFHVDNFDDFWREIIEPSVLEPLGLPIKGLTIVSPHKEAAFAAAASRSHMACKAGASNIFLRRNDSWEAHTTDTESVAGVAKKGANPREPIKAAVIGCGGAGRAIAAALQQAGAQVSLVNRGRERGDLAVRLLGLPFIALSNFEPTGFSLLVNATPVGRDDNSIPFDIDTLSPDTLVIDLVYRARPTSLATGVAARGGTIIDGYDVLLNQVRKQFHMMTGWELPSTVGRQTAASQGLGNGISSKQELPDESLAVQLAKVTALRAESAPPS